LIRPAFLLGLAGAGIAALLLLASTWPGLGRLADLGSDPFDPAAQVQRNGPILVWSDGSFVAIQPGGQRTTLPIGSHARSCPTFSPDGETIAYLRNGLGRDDGQLALADADGSDVRNLWTGRFSEQTFHQVMWSADGSTVAATKAGGLDGRSGTIVARPADGAVKVVDLGVGEFPGTLALSPDGRQLAALTYRPDLGQTQLELVDVASGARPALAIGARLVSVAWSPDGSTIAYTKAVADAARTTLNLVRPDGTTDGLATTEFAGAGSFGFMAWSRDGSRLGAIEFDGESTFSIRLFDSTGTAVDRLGPFTSEGNLSFTWSPDGRALVLTTAGVSRGLFGSPLVVSLHGDRQTLDVAGGYYTQCPLGWAAVNG
jgi:Tol biopolymer transport system component